VALHIACSDPDRSSEILHTHQLRGSERSIVAAIDCKADQKLRDDAGHNEGKGPDANGKKNRDRERLAQADAVAGLLSKW
jgi:hypothetical protein